MVPMNYFPVNKLAPKNGELTVFFKKVSSGKSDGFLVYEDGTVYLIDGGLARDDECLRFLIALREDWLSRDQSTANSKEAKLELHVIVSHPHPDHIGILPQIIQDDRFQILSMVGPERSWRSALEEGTLEPLVKCENEMDKLLSLLKEFGHTPAEIQRIPFGKTHRILLPQSDTLLTIYPSHIDWSMDFDSDSKGFRYLKQYSSPTYKNNPEIGYTNGILNGNSLWVKVEKEGRSILITGDQRPSDEMTGAMIRHYGEDAFRCDILKIPHHGEKNFCPYLLEIADAQSVVFTTMPNKATPETEEYCLKKGCKRFYVCDGNLLVTVKDGGIRCDGIESR